MKVFGGYWGMKEAPYWVVCKHELVLRAKFAAQAEYDRRTKDDYERERRLQENLRVSNGG